MSRRAALPRGRRAVASTVVAVLVIAAAVLSAITAVQLWSGRDRTALGDVARYAHQLHGVRWSDVGVLVAGIVLAALGALVLLAGLVPARPTLLGLADPDEQTRAGITRGGLRADMVATALAVDGIVQAKASIGRRRIRIVAATPFTDREGLADAVRSAAQRRVDTLQPVQRLAVRARLRRRVSRKET